MERHRRAKHLRKCPCVEYHTVSISQSTLGNTTFKLLLTYFELAERAVLAGGRIASGVESRIQMMLLSL